MNIKSKFPTLCRHRGGWHGRHGTRMLWSCGSDGGGAAAGEMLTITVSVWRAPELARGPLSPAILSLSLFLLLEGGGGGDKTEKRRKFEISTAARDGEWRVSISVLNRLIITAAGRCHLCSAVRKRQSVKMTWTGANFCGALWLRTDRRSQRAGNIKSKSFAEMPVLIQEM